MSSPGSRRQKAGDGRRFFLFLSLCLSVAAGATLLNISLVLSRPGIEAPISRPSALNEKIVRDFYATVNDVIRTGDAVALNAIVASDVVWCSPCSSELSTRDGLKRYLVRLHRTVPGARLEADSVVADFEGMVTAQVRVSGIPSFGEPIRWGPVEVLRVASGLIVERRNTPDDVTLVEPLLETRFDALPSGVNGMVMARLTFPLKSDVAGLLSPGPTILVVQSGAIEVRMEKGGRIVRGGDKTSIESSDSTLHQGDAAIIPPIVRYELSQVGKQPAVVLGVTLYYSEYVIDSSSGWDIGPTLAFAQRGAVAASSSLLPTVQILAGDTMDGWSSGPVQIAIEQAILGPGARMVPRPSEAMLLAVETGTLELIGTDEHTAAAGTAVARSAGSIRELHSANDGLVTSLIVTVEPVTD